MISRHLGDLGFSDQAQNQPLGKKIASRREKIFERLQNQVFIRLTKMKIIFRHAQLQQEGQ
jgi:hypothetical protein